MPIIDFHTHAFPDAIADKTTRLLEKEGGQARALDGRIDSLLASMARADIERAVVASIATRPAHFESILRWSESIASEKLIPFPSIHPDDPEAVARVGQIATAGFQGVKLHPYYQDFFMDEERLFPIYEAIAEAGLLLLMHTGYDFAYERIRRGDPARILTVLERVQTLKMITTHCFAWEDWEAARALLVGKPIYTDLSKSIEMMPRELARDMLLAHPPEYILFGTDSPWTDQQAQIDYLRSLELGVEREELILYENAKQLLR